jgi:hypothetical protein
MLPTLYAMRASRRLVSLVMVAAAGVLGGAQAATAHDSALSVSRVESLTNGKQLVSGRVNVVPVNNPFGFAVSVRNDSATCRGVLVKVVVSYIRRGESPLVLKTTGTASHGTVTVPLRQRFGEGVLFAQRARLTVAVTDRAQHRTSTRHYAVIFTLA